MKPEKHSHQAVPLRSRSQNALDHDLIGGVIKEGHTHACREQAKKRSVRVIRTPDQVETLRVGVNHGGPTSRNVVQGHKKEHQAATEQHDALRHISPHHGGKPSPNGVDPNQDYGSDKNYPRIHSRDVRKRQRPG